MIAILNIGAFVFAFVFGVVAILKSLNGEPTPLWGQCALVGYSLVYTGGRLAGWIR